MLISRFTSSSIILMLLCGLVYALPTGFQEIIVWSNINQPTAVRFAPNGRVFLIEKLGMVRTFDSINDTTATTVADLRSRVWSFHDHGMLGLEVDPQFPTRPYIYVLYSLRGVPGGRLSRLTLNTSTFQMISEQTIIEDWAQVYPSHSIGDLNFGPEGALYITAGDGASFGWADWGQDEPYNPDGSPLGGIDVDDPVNEGGALRSQDIRTTSDPLGLSGTLLRIHPDTGAAWPGNPLIGGAVNDDRILAYGLRNPFRFTVHPTLNSVWICDVGWNNWEELNRVPFPFSGPVPNFGWPGYEGVGRQPIYEGAGLPLLVSLYAAGTASIPYYTYQHTGGAAISGAAFYMGGDYPPEYDGAMFLADYARGDLHALLPKANGEPNPQNKILFIPSGVGIVDLQTGPSGDIFYIDIGDGQVRRIDYTQNNNPPVAVIEADVTSGNAPLLVRFDGTESSDPDIGDTIAYNWDLNGDGTFGDSVSSAPSFTYTLPGTYVVTLRVTDADGASDTGTITISVDNLPPVPEILTPGLSTAWRVNDVIQFSGRAIDPETGQMPASQLFWEVILHHCADIAFVDCHEHRTHEAAGVASGEFICIDHVYPCYIEIRLTATEPGQLGASATASLELFPDTSVLTLQTNPPGLEVGAFSATGNAPLAKEGIVNGATAVTTISPQMSGGEPYIFSSWSDGGVQSHSITISDAPMTLTANFVPAAQSGNNPPSFETIWDRSVSAGNAVGFYIVASDPDGTIPSVTGTNLPANAHLFDHYGDGRRYFEWYTLPEDAGDHTITVTAADNGNPPLSTSASFVIHVLSGNQAPGMDGVWDSTYTAGELIEFVVGAWDTDGDIPDLHGENLPPGATYFDDGWGAGFFNWQTDLADVGVYTGIRLVATDHGDPPMTNERSFKITVLGNANAPVIEPIPTTTVVAGDTLTLNVFAYDPNGTVPNLTAHSFPNGATFTPNGNGTGTISWPTDLADAGNHFGLSILATDSVTPSLTFRAMFGVRIIGAGNAPVLDPIGPKAVEEGDTLIFTVTASDPDSGAPALGVINLPIGATFIDNGNGTGTFMWVPAQGAAANSPYSITIEATDGAQTDSETVAITITAGNRAPIVAAAGPFTISEGQVWSALVTASDPDGAIPALSASGLPAGATFNDNDNGTGTLAWTPPYVAAGSSPYSMTITASDGALSDSETVVLSVSNTNCPPQITPTGNQFVAETTPLQFNVTATDPDGQTPTLSAQGLPSGANFTNNGNGTGTFSWTPSFGAGNGSPYSVIFTAHDGAVGASTTTSIVVSATNRPPVLAAIGNRTVNEAQLLQFTVSATDPDGVIPSLSAQGLPAGATFVASGNGAGMFSWTPNHQAAASSPYSVTFTASDGALSDTEQVSITVVNVNRAPVLTAIGNRTVSEGQLLQFSVTATDPDGQIPTWSAQGLPSGATLANNGNGVATFAWTPGFAAAGASPYSVTFTASDGALTAVETISIAVTNVNRSPVISAIGNKSVAEGALLQFTVSASDPDGQAPTWSAQGLPAGASIVNNGNGVATVAWTPGFAAAAASPYSVTFTASDGALTASETISMAVTNVNRAPVIAAIGNKTIAEGQQLQFTVTASDPDGQTPTWSAQNLPAGASFTNTGSGNGLFTWTPSATGSDGSPYPVTFIATDGQAQSSETINITVTNVTVPSGFAVLSPNGGDVWQHRDYVQIQWTPSATAGAKVGIQIWRNGSLNRIITHSTFNDGALTYRVPTHLSPGTGYKIRVFSPDNPSISDESDQPFTVIP